MIVFDGENGEEVVGSGMAEPTVKRMRYSMVLQKPFVNHRFQILFVMLDVGVYAGC